MATLLWLQTGSCSGDTMSLLTADSPSIETLVRNGTLDILWHPSLTEARPGGLGGLIAEIEAGTRPLDILCIEGSLITGPLGTGMFDSYRGRPKIQIAEALARRARHVVAVGTCAAFGGIPAAPPNPTDCTGLQFDRETPGGLLPPDWRSGAGLPVINLAGCPTHPTTITRSLAMIAQGLPLELDGLNRPRAFYGSTVHQGCTRNEYHDYNLEETQLGGRGCLFFNLGCQGPNTLANCNSELWNGRSSKPRAGVPCFGCTSPGFPKDGDLFRTEKIGAVPVALPLGVSRAHYIAYKNLAQAAMPLRIKNRDMEP
ncbi:NADH:ubiquinone oxidoreductase [Zoogloea sp.]|uniref:NADH-quinone oxidoreductase subunit B family protein n=1 Tax=Zoogloea sp. TaxID=49181 RepID=UPI002604CD47|nr:NADH:ubiquinone oxidoreductase [Zoogloea sp.]